MSRESQEAIRRLVGTSGSDILKRFSQLKKLHAADYSASVEPQKNAPPFAGVPGWGCVGCDYGLPWQTSIRVELAGGRKAIVDAHDCWGPEPFAKKGKAAAGRSFVGLSERFGFTPGPDLFDNK